MVEILMYLNGMDIGDADGANAASSVLDTSSMKVSPVYGQGTVDAVPSQGLSPGSRNTSVPAPSGRPRHSSAHTLCPCGRPRFIIPQFRSSWGDHSPGSRRRYAAIAGLAPQQNSNWNAAIAVFNTAVATLLGRLISVWTH
jgi:hypothetical protein